MTKADRLKMARRVRKELWLYLLFQKPHVRDGHANADDIAWACLLEARRELTKLINAEQAQRVRRAADQSTENVS
jgi:hypothetical protein